VNPSEVDLVPEHADLARRQALSDLARGMGHDFNNLLQGVLGAISVVKLSTPATHQLYPILELAEQSANQARELGRRLIYLAKGELPLTHTGPLGPLIRQAVEAGLRGASITSRFELEEGLEVRHDEQALRILVDILVLNAREAMAAGGTLTVSARRCDLAGDQVPGLAAGSYVRHTFQDTGRGMAEDLLPRIFEPYFTTKEGRTQKGAGVSLAVAQAIALSHGGALRADSSPGAGAAFHLYLPALPAA